MKFLDEIRQKPWTEEQSAVDNAHEGVAYVGLAKSKLGLRLLLTTITVVLSLFVIAYSDRMLVADWHDLSEPWLLWLNTALLVLSSLAMQKGVNAARDRQVEVVRTSLLSAGGLACGFLIGQMFVWQQLIGAGYFVAENPANAFFYLLTAVHGVHLLGGLVAWGRVVRRLGRGMTPDLAKLRESMELCAIYWHYLLIVWGVFFILLLFT